MITEAVSDATDPLYERIGQLERKMDTLRLESRESQRAPRPEIEVPADDAYGALEGNAVSRRSRVYLLLFVTPGGTREVRPPASGNILPDVPASRESTGWFP
jgi:hypothetical protein